MPETAALACLTPKQQNLGEEGLIAVQKGPSSLDEADLGVVLQVRNCLHLCEQGWPCMGGDGVS